MKKDKIIFNLSLLAICGISISLTFFGHQKLQELSNKKTLLANKIEALKKENNSLSEKNSELNSSKSDIEEIVKYANSKEYKFTIEEINALAENGNDELSEDDLENVSGGVNISAMPIISVVIGVITDRGIVFGGPNIPHRKKL